MIFAVIIFRPPAVDINRAVDNLVFGFPSGLQGGKIYKRLESRTGLPQRLNRAVKLAFVIIDPADHRFDGAVFAQNHGCALGNIAAGIGFDGFGKNFFRRLLNMLVKRGINVNIAVALADIGINLIINPVGKMAAAFDFIIFFGADRQVLRGLLFFFADDVVVDHILQHNRGTGFGAFF